MTRTTTTWQNIMDRANIAGDTREEKAKEMLERMKSDKELKGYQLRKCNAEEYGCRTLKSYNTLVAYFDGVEVIELGCYSRTTSKQVTKWAEDLGVDTIYRISNQFDMFRTLLLKYHKNIILELLDSEIYYRFRDFLW